MGAVQRLDGPAARPSLKVRLVCYLLYFSAAFVFLAHAAGFASFFVDSRQVAERLASLSLLVPLGIILAVIATGLAARYLDFGWIPWLLGVLIPWLNVAVLVLLVVKVQRLLRKHGPVEPSYPMTPRIIGTGHMAPEELLRRLESGASQCVRFRYCVSGFMLTFSGASTPFLVPAGKSPIRYSWPYSLTSFLLGWWGIPWGPIRTCSALSANMTGEDDLSIDVLNLLRAKLGIAPTPPPPGPAAAAYYVSTDQGATSKGPLTLAQIRYMLGANMIKPDVMVRPVDATTWAPLQGLLAGEGGEA